MRKIHPANLSKSAVAVRRGERKPPNAQQSVTAKKPKAANFPESHVPVGSLGVPVIVAARPSEKLKNLVPAEEAIRGREQARCRRRAQRARRRLATAVALTAIAASFLAGFGYVKFRAFLVARTNKKDVVEAPTNAKAFELLDRAVRARSEDQYDEAIKLAAQARSADPNLRGVDVFMAEIALQQQPDIVQLAAREALKRGHDVAGAKLLLALNSWRLRAQPGQSIDPAESAPRQVAEVCADAPFEGDAYFFLGEMQRALGKLALARSNFLSALHRMEPWSSASILEAKMQTVAADVSYDKGGQIVARHFDEEPAALRSSLTAWQLRQLGADKPGVNAGGPRKDLLNAHRTSPPQIRQGEQPPAPAAIQDHAAP